MTPAEYLATTREQERKVLHAAIGVVTVYSAGGHALANINEHLRCLRTAVDEWFVAIQGRPGEPVRPGKAQPDDGTGPMRVTEA